MDSDSRARLTARQIILAAHAHANSDTALRCAESAQTFYSLPNPAYGAARKRALQSLAHSVGTAHSAYQVAAALPWPYA